MSLTPEGLRRLEVGLMGWPLDPVARGTLIALVDLGRRHLIDRLERLTAERDEAWRREAEACADRLVFDAVNDARLRADRATCQAALAGLADARAELAAREALERPPTLIDALGSVGRFPGPGKGRRDLDDPAPSTVPERGPADAGYPTEAAGAPPGALGRRGAT